MAEPGVTKTLVCVRQREGRLVEAYGAAVAL
jgi:hypothetical protein